MKKSIKTLLIVFSLLAWAGHGTAQIIYFPYYGKNKVNYDKFDWNHYRTDHFDIYYYEKDVKTLKRIADMVESAYKRISQELKHQLSDVVPVLYYRTYVEFEQNNLVRVSEGVLGLAEPILYRFLIRGDIADDELQDLISHELTHIFQYDLLYGGPGMALYAVSQPPGWAMEGFADYNTKKWSSWSSLIVRDAVLNDRIPEFTEKGQMFSRYPLPRPADYDFGHAVFDYIEEKHGKTTIREFWHSMKNSSLTRRPKPVKKVFNQSPKEFSHDFKKYLRSKYKKFLLRENPEDYSITIGPEFPLNQYYFAFSHALSPSGDIVAALTFNVKESDMDIVLISTKSGKAIKNITKGYTLKYESIKYEIDASKGKNLDWSKDGDYIAFFARAGKKYCLFMVNVVTGKTERSIKIPADQPSGVHFLPNGTEVLFTGFNNGNHDIYKLNLNTEKIVNLTNDDLFQKAPAVSPDGQFIAYTIRIDVYDKLFLSPVNNLKEKTQLTFGRGHTITPAFSPDSKMIYFSGDQRESFNIYSLNLDTGELKRYTDVRTGNFFPTPVPNKPNNIVFSAFNKGSFQIFNSELEGDVEKTITFAKIQAEEIFKKFEPIISIKINKEKIKPLGGMGKLYIMSRPPVDAIVSTDGSLWGGSSIAFSDLMGNNIFSLSAYQVRSFRSYNFSYYNQRRRLQYMAQAYSYSIFYYTPYVYTDPSLYQFLNYRDAVAVRRIAGANIAALYPFNRYYRAEASFSFTRYEEDFFDPYLIQQMSATGTSFMGFINGNVLTTSFALTGETTHFKYYGPATGNTFRLSVAQTLPISSKFIQNTTINLDLRQYLYIGADTLFAARFYGFLSRGKNPYIFYWGGNNQVRSSYYYNIIANEGWYANFEFRFPVVNSANTIIGQIGPVRGTLFFDVSRAKLKGYNAEFVRYTSDFTPITYEAIGSYGFGFQFFFLGLPIHLEFVKALEFPKASTPWDFDVIGAWKTKFWIGFDF
jgi:hypothetical protein